MAKRATAQTPSPERAALAKRAKHAFEAVVDSIHDDHKMLEGEELWKAVVEVFGIARDQPVTKERP